MIAISLLSPLLVQEPLFGAFNGVQNLWHFMFIRGPTGRRIARVSGSSEMAR